MSNSNTINPYFEETRIDLDHSNTPIVPDGTGGFITRGASSRIQQGFVVFIDVLGIKGVWKKMSPDIVIKNWMEIIRQFAESIDKSLRHLKPYYTTLSDTIIITCECSISNINTIFQSLMQPFIHSVNLDFFLRGTISYGMTFISPRLILGPSIDEAAEWHNRLEWIGIVTTPNLSNYYLSEKYENRTNNYIFYPRIPIKGIKRDWDVLNIEDYKGFALNWFDKGNTVQQVILDKKNTHSDLKVKRKYENTLDFFSYCNRI